MSGSTSWTRTSRCWRRGSIPVSAAPAPSGPATSAPRSPPRPRSWKRTATNWRAAATGRAPAAPQASHYPEGDLGLHIDELLLDQLVAGERPAELAPSERVVARRVPAKFGGAERAPGDAVAGVIEAGERPAQALHIREDIV